MEIRSPIRLCGGVVHKYTNSTWNIDRPSVEGTGNGQRATVGLVGWEQRLLPLSSLDPPVGLVPRHEWDDFVGRGLNPRPTPSLLPVPC